DHTWGLMKYTYHMLYWTYQTPAGETSTIEETKSGVAGTSTTLAVGPALAIIFQRYICTISHLIAGLHNTIHLESFLGALALVSAVAISAIARHVCNNNYQKNRLLTLLKF
ncbi:hypothetical protein, partial [Salmonella sp. NW860]|uniref:hypothetical protein n=1 Tax=Salmonella sp. NW860 TaxID=2948342 RepID=UPI003F437FC9